MEELKARGAMNHKPRKPRQSSYPTYAGQGIKPSFLNTPIGKRTYIAGVISILKMNISCHYTPHPINYDMTIKSTPGLLPFVTCWSVA
jgi:hypothetical protein